MKRLIVFGVLFIALATISSCKKEIIKPNESVKTSEHGDRINQQSISVTGSSVGGNNIGGSNEGTGAIGGDITDPNDDDYTRKPKKKI